MNEISSQKVTVSLSADALAYADLYKEKHGLNRSEVFTLALKLLCEKELLEGYCALATEQLAKSDSLTDSGLSEVLEQTEW